MYLFRSLLKNKCCIYLFELKPSNQVSVFLSFAKVLCSPKKIEVFYFKNILVDRNIVYRKQTSCVFFLFCDD